MMTSSAAQSHGAGFLEESWDRSTYYRPQYPPSLVKLIIDFQRAHSNSFRLAHDVGSGFGVFAPRLAEYFQHVHVSGPKATSIDSARPMFDKWFAENWWKAKFTFSVTPAEKADEAVAKGSVDLVTVMQNAHWTAQDAMVNSIAKSLTPNGTLAVVQIDPMPTVLGNEALKGAVRRLFEFYGRNVFNARGGRESLMGTRYLPQLNAGVDCVPLPEGVFIQDVTKRIDINVRGRGATPHAIPGFEQLVAPSRAVPQDRRYQYESEDDDEEAAGWRYKVDAGWFTGLIGTMEQKAHLHLYEDHLKEVERLVKETTRNGQVEIEWTVSILLATRK